MVKGMQRPRNDLGNGAIQEAERCSNLAELTAEDAQYAHPGINKPVHYAPAVCHKRILRRKKKTRR